MMLLLLGLMDALILILLIAMKYEYHPTFRIVSLAMLYLIGKAVIFRGSLMNWIDVFVAVFILFMYFGFGLHGILSIIIIAYLSYKLAASILL